MGQVKLGKFIHTLPLPPIFLGIFTQRLYYGWGWHVIIWEVSLCSFGESKNNLRKKKKKNNGSGNLIARLKYRSPYLPNIEVLYSILLNQ